MKNKLFIDGRDAFIEYGVFVEKNGFKQLIQLAAFKKIDTTDWPEEDGIEPDLIDPQLDTRTLQIQFCITNIRYAEDLFDELSIGAYHTLEFREIKKTFKLRLTQNGSFSSLIKLGKLTLTFSDDFPQVPTDTHYALDKTDIRQIGFEVDGVDFSQFGTYILNGTEDNIRKAANTKENLKVSTKDRAGVVYDATAVNFKSKDVTVKLLIDAPDIDEFWKRFNGLFAVVLQPETRTFYYAALGNEYDCYYKSMSVSKFDILRSGKVWCEFSIVLTFINYRPVGQYMVLAHEDFSLLEVLVNGEPTLIRIRPKKGISLLVHQSGEYVIVDNGNDQSQIFLND
ncbi:MAG: hypothetical protein NC548_24430 [Lachnospiraceae bacterium]|nr:hypothetical protein [Lachnospiraceae bacterium]